MPGNGRQKQLEDFLIAGSFLAGSGAFMAAFFTQKIEDPFALGCLVLLTVLCEALSVRLYFDGRVSISFVGTVLTAVLFGPLGGVLAAAATALTGFFLASRNPRKLIFNFGHETFSAAVTGWVMLAMGAVATDHTVGSPERALLGGFVGAAILYSIDAWSVATIISVTSGKSVRTAYRDNFAWLLPHYLVLGLVAGGLAVMYGELGIASVLVLGLPLLMSRYAISQFVERTRENVVRLERSNEQLQHAYVEIKDMSEELKDAYTGTLESLVTALDVRDQETRGHSVRVATHSLDMAKMLGIKADDELLTVYRGALMHDVGKIGVPDAILLKPAKLTEEEWEFMRRHPALGYRILAQVPYLRPAAKIVLAHHERWDGDGYPRRLKGEDIPLGARIFAICDTYDAIISDRPYRKGQSPDAAMAEILRCAGTQFDPKVVEAFEAAFPRWRDEEHGDSRKPLYLPAWRQENDAPGRAAG
jgi:hypothetical protein